MVASPILLLVVVAQLGPSGFARAQWRLRAHLVQQLQLHQVSTNHIIITIVFLLLFRGDPSKLNCFFCYFGATSQNSSMVMIRFVDTCPGPVETETPAPFKKCSQLFCREWSAKNCSQGPVSDLDTPPFTGNFLTQI